MLDDEFLRIVHGNPFQFNLNFQIRACKACCRIAEEGVLFGARNPLLVSDARDKLDFGIRNNMPHTRGRDGKEGREKVFVEFGVCGTVGEPRG